MFDEVLKALGEPEAELPKHGHYRIAKACERLRRIACVRSCLILTASHIAHTVEAVLIRSTARSRRHPRCQPRFVKNSQNPTALLFIASVLAAGPPFRYCPLHRESGVQGPTRANKDQPISQLRVHHLRARPTDSAMACDGLATQSGTAYNIAESCIRGRGR
jgi:hypothetical protein